MTAGSALYGGWCKSLAASQMPTPALVLTEKKSMRKADRLLHPGSGRHSFMSNLISAALHFILGLALFVRDFFSTKLSE